MGSIRFNVPRSDRPASELLARLPRAFRDDAEKGIAVLASIPSGRYEGIVKSAIVTLESRRPPLDRLEKILDLPVTDVSNAFTAAMLIIPMVGEGTNLQEFIEAAVKIKLIDQNLLPKLRPFFDVVVSHGKVIAAAIKRASLSDQVFPAFYDLSVAVDLRIGFGGQDVDVAVPVALIHIDTDAEDQQLWFQCSKQQLLAIRDEIDETLKKMDTAESWARREPKP